MCVYENRDLRTVRFITFASPLPPLIRFTFVVIILNSIIFLYIGEPMYEVIKNIPANTELIVHYLPERPEEIFFMPAVHYLRNTLYRRTMDTILEGKPSSNYTVRAFLPIFCGARYDKSDEKC